MIKIFYRDLSPGLHASAEAKGKNTVISFLPGLTPDQRRAALRRIRHSGRMGHGPRVPAGKLAIALALDRVKAAVRTGAAVVRLHPAGSTLPVVFFSAAAVIFVLMATVSIHVLPAAPRSFGPDPAVGGVTPAPATSAPVVSQAVTPPGGSRTSRMGTVPGRLAARQLSSSGTTTVGSSGLASTSQGSGPAVSSASPAAGTGSAPASSATGSAASPRPSGSPGSAGSGGTTGSAGTGSGSPGASAGSGSGTSSGGGGSSGIRQCWIRRIGFRKFRIGVGRQLRHRIRFRFGRLRFGRLRFGRLRFGRLRFRRLRFGRLRFWRFGIGRFRIGRFRIGRSRFWRFRFWRSRFGRLRFRRLRFGRSRIGEHGFRQWHRIGQRDLRVRPVDLVVRGSVIGCRLTLRRS